MSWLLNSIIVSALIIMIAHCVYEYFKDGGSRSSVTDLTDLKTQQYKTIIENMVKANDVKKMEDDEMDKELTEYVQSKLE
jgi:hypothetical protein